MHIAEFSCLLSVPTELQLIIHELAVTEPDPQLLICGRDSFYLHEYMNLGRHS